MADRSPTKSQSKLAAASTSAQKSAMKARQAAGPRGLASNKNNKKVDNLSRAATRAEATRANQARRSQRNMPRGT